MGREPRADRRGPVASDGVAVAARADRRRGGPPRVSNRAALAGILFVLRHGLRWLRRSKPTRKARPQGRSAVRFEPAHLAGPRRLVRHPKDGHTWSGPSATYVSGSGRAARFNNLLEARRQAQAWCLEVAGDACTAAQVTCRWSSSSNANAHLLPIGDEPWQVRAAFECSTDSAAGLPLRYPSAPRSANAEAGRCRA